MAYMGPVPGSSPLVPPLPSRIPAPPWQSSEQLRQHLARLLDDASLLSAVADELEAVVLLKATSGEGSAPESPDTVNYSHLTRLIEVLKGKGSPVESLESSALEAATSLQRSVGSQLAALLPVLQGSASWEETAAVSRLSGRQLKTKRNRKWRQKQRQLLAEARRKEKARYDQADQEADEWRAREIAKDIARWKMEKMKEVAKQKAKEERRKLEEELELVLIVEKLQELRSLRIQRLKKQGRFFPEEDNTFMERVQAAVEEEERQAAAAADTSAAAAAIANAEEAGKAVAPTSLMAGIHNEKPLDQVGESPGLDKEERDTTASCQGIKPDENRSSNMEISNASFQDNGALPPEFYHYYHGSSADMGTLIEVRRTWDTFIFTGGSRIPGHWVEPPPPADAVWASCLVNSNNLQKERLHS